MDINDLADFLIVDSSDTREDDELPDEINEESIDEEDLPKKVPVDEIELPDKSKIADDDEVAD